MDVALIDAGAGLAVDPPVLPPALLPGCRASSGHRCSSRTVRCRRSPDDAGIRCSGRANARTPRARSRRSVRPGIRRRPSARSRPPIEQPISTGRSSASACHTARIDAEIGSGGEPVAFQPPAVGRIAIGRAGQIERDHAEALRHLGIVQHMAELAAVGSGGVQAQAAACRCRPPPDRGDAARPRSRPCR